MNSNIAFVDPQSHISSLPNTAPTATESTTIFTASSLTIPNSSNFRPIVENWRDIKRTLEGHKIGIVCVHQRTGALISDMTVEKILTLAPNGEPT